MPLTLSRRQESTITVALTILSTLVILAAIGALLWLLGAFLNRFSNVFLPLAVSGVAALVFNPYFEWLRDKLRLPAGLALAVVFLSILLPIAGFVWFFGAMVVEQLTDLFHRLPAWWDGVMTETRERWPQVIDFFETNPWGQRLKQALEGSEEKVLEGLQLFGGGAMSAGAMMLRWLGALLGWAVAPVYFSFFLLAEAKNFQNLDRHLPFLKPETRNDLIYLAREFVKILVAFFRGQFLVALGMGVLFAIGFWLVGLSYGIALGLILGLLNVIPYLGSIIGMSIALPLSFFQEGGGLTLAILVVVVFTVVQIIEAYVLTPRIMGGRTGLHPMVIIVAVFFWGSALGGIAGMILAIPLTAFLVVFWRLARDKYIEELV